MTDMISSNKVICRIFCDVKYFVTGNISEQVRKILNEGGAEKTNFFSDMVTHCIVGQQPRENDISDAKDLYEVPAVTPYWVLISAFCNKILPTRGFIYDSKQIFSNVIVTASQVSNADFKALWAMVTFYGGKFKIALDKSSTHLICGKPFGEKYETALNISNIKVVTPDWVVESIKTGSRVDEDFYHPKNLIFPKTRENSPAGTANDLSTAQILGFAEDINPSPLVIDAASSVTSTQALLEKLKQRMPWNRPSPSVSTSNSISTSPYCNLPQNTATSQLQSQIPQTSQVSMLNNQTVHLQTSPSPPQQIERITVDQHGRISQQNSLWRSATIQTIRPQYTLIQRDGPLVQPSQTTNWAQYHLQQRLQQQNQGQPTPAIQQHQQNLSTQQSIAQQPPQMQQAVILQNSQIQSQSQGAANIQTANQTQRQITWTQQATPKQVIQLDPQTHAQLSQMDPHQRTLFLQKIQRQKQIILQQRQLQLQHQQRPITQGGKLNSHQQSSTASGQQQSQPQQQNLQQQTSPTPLRQQQIIIRGIMPPGLTTQQQAAWLHQQQFIRQQQILLPQQTNQVRSSINVSQTRISQQQSATSTWIPQSDNTQQQHQQQQQLQLQRQQQFRIQQLQIQKQQQIVVQRAVSSIPQQFHQTSQPNLSTQNQPQGMHSDDSSVANPTVGTVGGGLLVNNRTKTALANMLSSRLQTGLLSPQAQNLNQPDNSASGQLRLMSAQQRASQPPPSPSPSAVQLPEAQTGLYGQQRRTLGNISSSGLGVKNSMAIRDVQPTGTSILVSKTPGRTVLTASTSSSGPASPQKSQFFTHNPSLRIPADKYFLGCIFFIVEYDQIESNNLSDWEETIKDHGGEIESSYTPRVTHVLCETQKHGIVQQALRDGKRCITAFWLNDVVLKGGLSIPWLALHFPVPFGREKPLSKYHVTLTGFEDKVERQRVATMIQVAGGQYRNYLSPLTHIVVCRKSEGAKYKKAKETNKITVNVQWLNEVLFGHYTCIQQPDIQKYQQYNCSNCFRVDYALIPHLMGAWKLPINVTSELYASVKNLPSPPRKIKKLKLEPTLEQKMEFENKVLESIQITNIENFNFENRPHILITGDKNLDITKKAKEIGCILAKNNNKITHLVVCGKPRRTLKMLKSLIVAKHIVTDSWIEDCYNQKKLLNESCYSILQADFDDFKCNISKILSSSDRSNIFKDKIFYLTPNVEPSKKALIELILLCGGQVEKQRRSIKTIQELNKTTQTYIVISCYNDLALISDIFRAKLDIQGYVNYYQKLLHFYVLLSKVGMTYLMAWAISSVSAAAEIGKRLFKLLMRYKNPKNF